MAYSRNLLIPSRFLFTIGHFITVVMAFFQRKLHVIPYTALEAPLSVQNANMASLNAALSISIICFAIQFFGLMGGFTMFSKQLNVFHCVCHFVGTLFTGWFLVQVWGYKSYWPIMVLFNLIPTVAEAIKLLSVFSRKKKHY